ncbi:unnamed protein product [Mytilus coruscus]|uniref:Tyr recombinase domain-containing protein n=1 Tax=Mytilus coruscus TaxID=42192 RepID=A0A6J8E1W8_MYTCO|nr:unnamed protein product [Mytilus coruscus]
MPTSATGLEIAELRTKNLDTEEVPFKQYGPHSDIFQVHDNLNMFSSYCDYEEGFKNIHVKENFSSGILKNSDLVQSSELKRLLSHLRSTVIDSRAKTTVSKKKNAKLSYTRAREIVKAALSFVGLDAKLFGLHSFRSGGASAAANNGISDRLFKAHGRWKTENAKDGYIADNLDKRLSVSRKLGICHAFFVHSKMVTEPDSLYNGVCLYEYRNNFIANI